MSENLRQSLSALMDNEADELEARRALKELGSEESAVWSRYHLVSALLNGEKPNADVDLSSRVMSALDAEPAYKVTEDESPASDKNGLFWKPLASVAIAASVTAMIIFGAQTFQGGAVNSGGESLANNNAEGNDAFSRGSVVLPGPSPATDGLLPAQYGRGGKLSLSTGSSEPDVIRLSYGMEHYINQHNSLLRSKEKVWAAEWLPDGFSPLRHEVMPDSEVMIYSDGRTSISVCVEAYGTQKSVPGAVQSGDTVALGKRVGGQFVTVVGDIPLMIADRIAGSVNRSSN
ncbi:MucB/RseB C-terminal domain-containing protein [Motiliproteus sp. MSK22-1]|uniref:MucB/RseB C-terminal domain-containing protein n=1 Tax=Motiliproteus sp. MSK22-1 TaxID=1897630 RepID=UPI00097614FC|nr:MucB/RseB C-terminal domain-containing protein [Motiliproteus sp. MSK22-1]OMH38119.1 hypothetical protein BGP75_07555 [Motiliproteus sp. MSK22-1]